MADRKDLDAAYRAGWKARSRGLPPGTRKDPDLNTALRQGYAAHKLQFPLPTGNYLEGTLFFNDPKTTPYA